MRKIQLLASSTRAPKAKETSLAPNALRRNDNVAIRTRATSSRTPNVRPFGTALGGGGGGDGGDDDDDDGAVSPSPGWWLEAEAEEEESVLESRAGDD